MPCAHDLGRVGQVLSLCLCRCPRFCLLPQVVQVNLLILLTRVQYSVPQSSLSDFVKKTLSCPLMKEPWSLYYLRKLLISAPGDTDTSCSCGAGADEIAPGEHSFPTCHVISALDARTIERVRQFCSSRFPDGLERSIKLSTYSLPHSEEAEGVEGPSHTMEVPLDTTCGGVVIQVGTTQGYMTTSVIYII